MMRFDRIGSSLSSIPPFQAMIVTRPRIGRSVPIMNALFSAVRDLARRLRSPTRITEAITAVA